MLRQKIIGLVLVSLASSMGLAELAQADERREAKARRLFVTASSGFANAGCGSIQYYSARIVIAKRDMLEFVKETARNSYRRKCWNQYTTVVPVLDTIVKKYPETKVAYEIAKAGYLPLEFIRAIDRYVQDEHAILLERIQNRERKAERVKISKVQRFLRNRGHYQGPIDGELGPKTSAAIIEFEKANLLKPTGKITPTLERGVVEAEKKAAVAAKAAQAKARRYSRARPRRRPPASREDFLRSMLCDVAPEKRAGRLDGCATMTEIDAIRRQIEACWSIPAGARSAEHLVVGIRVWVNPDGKVARAEILDRARMGVDTFFRSAAESAMRAVLNPRCSPLRFPPKKYDLFKVMVLSFNPREATGR